MSGLNGMASPGGGGRAKDALEALRLRLKRCAVIPERLAALDQAEGAAPGLEREGRRALEAAPEAQVMQDDALRLIKAWSLQREGRPGAREYYTCAFAEASDRRAIREALGVPDRLAVEQAAVLVTVDCMRGDRVGAGGCPRPLTPALDALAGEGVYFPRAYSTAGQTAQSFPGILLSNFFQNFGRARVVPDHLTTLAEVLSANGFHAAAYNAANPHVSHFYGYDRGFDEFHDFLGADNFSHGDETFCDHSPRRLRPPSDEELMAVFEDCQAHPDIYDILRETTGKEGMPLVRAIAERERFYPYHAADMVQGALGGLLGEGAGRRRFLWLHLMDLHENITVPWSPLGSFTPVQRFFLNMLLTSPLGVEALRPYADKYCDLYESAVAYVDLNIGILRTFLADHGLLERSLLCVTADHGQELLERGVFGHGYDRLAEGVVHVPLLFAGGLAGRLRAEGSERPVSTLDIAPTLLDLLAVREAPESFLGATLNDAAPRPVHGQTFYEAADNKCAGARAFELKPFPAPVRECCPEMFYRIEGGYQIVHDRGTGQTQVRRLKSAPPGTPGSPPDAEDAKRRAEEYLSSVYELPEEAGAFQLSGADQQVVEARLRDLGYL